MLVVLAALLFFGHDLLTPSAQMSADVTPPGTLTIAGRFIKSLFLSPGAFPIGPNRLLVIAYPVLPWLGIMLAGFVAARWFQQPAEQRKKIFIRMGILSLGLFLLLRFINLYGDPDPWSAQKNAVFTILSFLNVSKYPPSLLFSLVTLGILFLMLAAAEKKTNAVTRVLLVYGRVPLFYFIIHMYLIHLVLLAVDFLQGFAAKDLLFGPFQFGRPAKGFGLPLVAVYMIWAGLVIALYPLCKWYGRYKAAHPEKGWLKYI